MICIDFLLKSMVCLLTIFFCFVLVVGVISLLIVSLELLNCEGEILL